MRVVTAFADRCYHSFQLERVGRNSNFTLTALKDRIRLENLEVSATFWMGCSVGTRSSWNLGEVRRAADAMRKVSALVDGVLGISKRAQLQGQVAVRKWTQGRRAADVVSTLITRSGTALASLFFQEEETRPCRRC